MHFSLGSRPLSAAALLLLTAAAPRPAAAILPPAYDGYHLLWYDAFHGAAGSAPNNESWNIITGPPGINNELETYTASPRNVQLSGGGTLQLVPWRDASASGGGGWTSGRIESRPTVTPAAGRITRVEGALRTGDAFGNVTAAQQQGLWPAFFLLGDAMRHGTEWPLCGELDILEQVNGLATGYGTAHCTSGCNEPTGRGGAVAIPSVGATIRSGANATASASTNTNTNTNTTAIAAHVWSVTWDLTSSDWQAQTIAWALDGQPYFSLTGAAIGDQGTWSTLAHSPFYAILNVAVGGNFPGNPTGETVDGYSNMLEVLYVAVYSN